MARSIGLTFSGDAPKSVYEMTVNAPKSVYEMTVNELKAFAKERGYNVPASGKERILAAIQEARAATEDPEDDGDDA